MANKVFVNNREVACKAANGKSICSFPDVCFTPPQTPATPAGVPIPYPNTGMAKDLDKGSKKVKISGKPVALKDKSYLKKSMGDEAGNTPKKGLLTSKVSGKVYFNSWSMDVKVEGENVVRHLDLTTHNHGSVPGNTPTWPYLDTMNMDSPTHEKCAKDKKKEEEACKGVKNPCPPHKPPQAPSPPPGSKLASLRGKRSLSESQKETKDKLTKAWKKTKKYREDEAAFKKAMLDYYENLADKNKDNKCLKARRCMLSPYVPNKKKGQKGCCPGQTGHHLIPVASFLVPGTRKKGGTPNKGCEGYNMNQAPCVCAEGTNNTTATHGLLHTYDKVRSTQVAPEGKIKLKDAAKIGAGSLSGVFPESDCDPACIEAQIIAYHENAGIKKNQVIASSPSGSAKGAGAKDAKNYWAKIDKAKKEATKSNFREERKVF